MKILKKTILPMILCLMMIFSVAAKAELIIAENPVNAEAIKNTEGSVIMAKSGEETQAPSGEETVLPPSTENTQTSHPVESPAAPQPSHIPDTDNETEEKPEGDEAPLPTEAPRITLPPEVIEEIYEELEVKELYLSQSASQLIKNEIVNLNLNISAYNSDTKLNDFNISIDVTGFVSYWIKDYNGGDVSVSSNKGKLILNVKNAYVNNGEILVNGGEPLRLNMNAVGFKDSKREAFASEIKVYNPRGINITPADRNNGGAKVARFNYFYYVIDNIVANNNNQPEQEPAKEIEMDMVVSQGSLKDMEQTALNNKEENPAVEKSAKIISNISNEKIKIGDTVVMEVLLSGFENDEYVIQWQSNSGEGWVDIPNENNSSYQVNMDKNTIYQAFRFVIKTKDK